MTRRLWYLTALLLATVVSLSAYSYIDDEQITVAGTAIGFTATKLDPVGGARQATIAVCILETADIRYRVNGSSPTSSVGMLVKSGSSFTITGHDQLLAFSAIRTGSSATLSCTYYAQ